MSQKYIFDTDIIIDVVKDKNEISQKVRKVDVINCYVSEITIAELIYGVEKGGRAE